MILTEAGLCSQEALDDIAAKLDVQGYTLLGQRIYSIEEDDWGSGPSDSALLYVYVPAHTRVTRFFFGIKYDDEDVICEIPYPHMLLAVKVYDYYRTEYAYVETAYTSYRPYTVDDLPEGDVSDVDDFSSKAVDLGWFLTNFEYGRFACYALSSYPDQNKSVGDVVDFSIRDFFNTRYNIDYISECYNTPLFQRLIKKLKVKFLDPYGRLESILPQYKSYVEALAKNPGVMTRVLNEFKKEYVKNATEK